MPSPKPGQNPFVEQLAELLPNISSLGVKSALERLYDVEAVGKQFFSEYRRAFEAVMAAVVGLPDGEERRLFCQTLFNRLMFLYFLQRKGCLTFNGSADYLNALWKDHTKAQPAAGTFYRTRLHPLFFLALNNERSEEFTVAPRLLEAKIGRVPFLNGGLFAEDDLDRRSGVDVPDEAIRRIVKELFERFNFTITESTPYDVEVAVDPEMLGKVFEELVTGRHESGSYYTPRPIVSFMGKEALKGYLAHALPAETPEAIERFVDEHSAADLRDPERALGALKRVRICDPACGSGAYLLGMLQELLALRDRLFTEHRVDPKGIYERKLEIIQDNLYGVDIDPFAVNIARLRLWLSLILDYAGATPPPLPNLDFKIERGDSLLAPSPEGVGQLGLRDALIPQFREAKARYARAHGEEKRIEREHIEQLQADIARATHFGKGPGAGFDWAVAFAEVFGEGGFDIILANPPYVRQELIKDLKPELKQVFPEVYNGTADLYCYFYARALQLLKPGGMLTFISSNKWLKAGYGANLRLHLVHTCRLQSITDFGDLPVFEAASAYPMILVAQKGGRAAGPTIYTEVRSLAAPYPDVLAIIRAAGYPLLRDALDTEDWLITDPGSAACYEKMRYGNGTLGQYLGGSVYRGVVTGLNKAFVISGKVRVALLSRNPQSAAIIKPLVEGKSLTRWRIKSTDRWLIVTPVGIHIGRYPAILDHLKPWAEALAKRWDRGNEWWELRPCDYYDAFEQPKIMYPDIAQVPRFVFDTAGYFTLNTGYFFPCDQPWVAGILNSHAVEFFLAHLSPPVRGGYLRFYTSYVEKIPLPIPSADVQVRLTDAVLRLASGDDEETERAIDRLVYDHVFKLTAEESHHIEQWVQRRRAQLGKAIEDMAGIEAEEVGA